MIRQAFLARAPFVVTVYGVSVHTLGGFVSRVERSDPRHGLGTEEIMSNEESAARFLDEHRCERGWASKVVKRERALGRLVVLDVTTADRDLLRFLCELDKSPLH